MDYEVSETHKWGILTRGFLEAFKPIVRTINVSLKEQPYPFLLIKLQELSRKDVEDPNTPIEQQRKSGQSGISGSAINTTDSKKGGSSSRNFKARFHWCLNIGHIMADCRNNKKGEPKTTVPKGTETANIAEEKVQEPTKFVFTSVEKSKVPNE